LRVDGDDLNGRWAGIDQTLSNMAPFSNEYGKRSLSSSPLSTLKKYPAGNGEQILGIQRTIWKQMSSKETTQQTNNVGLEDAREWRLDDERVVMVAVHNVVDDVRIGAHISISRRHLRRKCD
jgi:hypothetical protein